MRSMKHSETIRGSTPQLGLRRGLIDFDGCSLALPSRLLLVGFGTATVPRIVVEYVPDDGGARCSRFIWRHFPCRSEHRPRRRKGVAEGGHEIRVRLGGL